MPSEPICSDGARRARLRWGCRRGMLELDLVLETLAGRIADMSEREIGLVQELLAHDDQQLWDMLIARRAQPPHSLRELAANISGSAAVWQRPWS